MILSKFTGKACFVAFLLMVIILTGLSVKALEAEELLKDIYRRQGFGKGSYILEIQVDLQQKNEVQTSHVRVYLHESNKQLVTFLSPQRMTGQSFLVSDNNTWMHQEGLNRPLRISPQQKLFGEAGIAETIGIDYLNDYRITERAETPTEHILDLEATDVKTAYQRARLWIDKEEVKIEKVVLMAINGLPLKELIFSDYCLLNDHEVARIDIRNLLSEKDQNTVINYLSIEESRLPAEIFDPLLMGKSQFLLKKGEKGDES